MRLESSRRLMGANLYSSAPGAIAEVRWQPAADPGAAIAAWRGEARRLLDAVGWEGSELYDRAYRGGAALFLTAPIDQLMPATEINEWAVASAAGLVAGTGAADIEPARLALRADIEANHWPGLAEIAEAARQRGATFILDDNGMTLGAGGSAISFARRAALPSPAEIEWGRIVSIPIGLITGTNGKTTCSRLVARIARLAGRHPGNTSSDGVLIDEQLIERGDCSGPDGARTVLRHPETDIAVLETARGGILRRGLAVARCEAALITNISADHLGDYGVDELGTLARVKAVVGREAKTVILNADDPMSASLAPTFSARLVYFALDADNATIAAHRASGGEAWFSRAGHIVRARGELERPLVAEADVPLTFGGLARYNTENALASAALAAALGLPEAAICAGLKSFSSSTRDNPGRGNHIELGGVDVMLDFGHNAAAVRAVTALATSILGSGRLFVAIGIAGDRTDSEIAAVAGEIAAARPHLVLVRELADYMRGREPGEVPGLLRDGLVAAGLEQESIADAESELDSVRRAVGAARPGDLVLCLCHLDADVKTWLAAEAAKDR